MKSFGTFFASLIFVLVVFLCLSAVADAKDDDSGQKLPKHARVLQTQIDANSTSIENIELTPGPAGADGAKGDTGEQGVVILVNKV